MLWTHLVKKKEVCSSAKSLLKNWRTRSISTTVEVMMS